MSLELLRDRTAGEGERSRSSSVDSSAIFGSVDGVRGLFALGLGFGV